MSALAWTDIELPGAMPGGYAAGLTPRHPDLEAMVADGWRIHEHSWLGNGYVRVRMYRERPLPTLANGARLVLLGVDPVAEVKAAYHPSARFWSVERAVLVDDEEGGGDVA